jgi:hypothetical protein
MLLLGSELAGDISETIVLETGQLESSAAVLDLYRHSFNQGISRSRTPSGAGRASLSIEPQTFGQEAHLTAPNTSGGVRG